MVWRVWGTGKPLVLLHGGSGSWNHWVRNIDALVGAGFEVFAPDLPGMGESALPAAGRDADALPEPLERGLQTLVGDRAVDLVGFSFGGLTAGLFATRFPQRVARLVIVGAPVIDRGGKRSVRLLPWRETPEGPERDAILRHNLQQLMLWNPEAIDGLALSMHAANTARDRMPGRRLALVGALGKAVPQLTCPLWAIYGEHDTTFADAAPAVISTLAKAPHWHGLTQIADAGHWVQFEQAERFNAALLTVLVGQP